MGYHRMMTSEGDAARNQRALARGARIGIARVLGPSERVALAAELTRIAWSLSGKPWPGYTRATTPIRVIDRRSR